MDGIVNFTEFSYMAGTKNGFKLGLRGLIFASNFQGNYLYLTQLFWDIIKHVDLRLRPIIGAYSSSIVYSFRSYNGMLQLYDDITFTGLVDMRLP